VLPAARATYPERPVRLIVRFQRGGVNDMAFRIVANRLGGFGEGSVAHPGGGARQAHGSG